MPMASCKPYIPKGINATKNVAQIPAGAMYFVDIDVSNIQGQHRIVLGFGTNNPNGDVVTSQVNVLANNDSIGIGHIEFIN